MVAEVIEIVAKIIVILMNKEQRFWVKKQELNWN